VEEWHVLSHDLRWLLTVKGQELASVQFGEDGSLIDKGDGGTYVDLRYVLEINKTSDVLMGWIQ
jgi:hypothetical protein